MSHRKGLGTFTAVHALPTAVGAVLLAWPAAPCRAQEQPAQRPASITGVVVARSGAPVVGADVALTRAPDMAVTSQVTDSSGAFVFVSPGGSGEYLLSVAAKGYRPRRQRVAGPLTVGTLRIVLDTDSVGQALAPVVVVAVQPRPAIPTGAEVGTGSSSRVADGVPAALPLASDRIADAASLTLGSSSRGGVSVLGLPPSETQVQLGGMLFRGDALPRNAPRIVRTTTSSQDIANGGFSAALVSVDVPAAGELEERRGDVAWVGTTVGGDQVARSIGHVVAPSVLIDVGGATRFNRDSSGLSGGMRLAATRVPSADLGSASGDLLAAHGIEQTRAAAASDLATSRLGLPTAREGSDPGEVRFSSLFRFDPRVSRTAADAIVFGFNGASRGAASSAVTAAATLGTDRSGGDVFAQWQHSHISADGARWDLRAGLAASLAEERPTSTGPTLLVDTRQATGQPDSLAGTIGLGGNAGGARREARQVVEFVAQREKYAGARDQHLVKLYASGRLDFLQLAGASRVDEIGFASLSDFANSVPAWVTSSQLVPELRGQAGRLSLGLGDEWRARDHLRLQFGARVDAQQLRGPSGADVHLPASLGPGWQLPMQVDVSPRLGLSWAFAAPSTGTGISTTSLFQRHVVPSGVLHLGLGWFQRDWEPDYALRPGGSWSQRIDVNCNARGLAPVNWAGVRMRSDTMATLCMAPGGDPLARRRVGSATLGAGARAPTSVRANASLLTTVRSVDVFIEGILSATRNQLGYDDVNLVRAPFSSLSLEGGRPLFVSPSAIEASSGIATSSASRFNDSVSTAFVYSSTRRTTTTQLLVQLSPRWYDDVAAVRLSYLWSRSRSLEGGWDRDAFGDPRALEWADAAADARHRFQLEVGRAWGGLSATMWLRAESGRPFTPLVSGDVNGDGNPANDRAFVFSPSTTSDTALANGLTNLLSRAPSYARDCLLGQLDRPASRGSCRGPWTLTSNLSLRLEGAAVGLGRRVALSASVENLAGLIDGLLHGSNPRGWGGDATPDAYLLRVRGFDTTRRAFAYDVNPRFGQALAGAGFLTNPYRVTLSASIDLAPPAERQQVERWLRSGGVTSRRTRLSADELARKFARNVPNLYATILEERDALYLTEEQLRWIDQSRGRFDQALERAWGPLGRDLSALPDDFDADSAVARIQLATDDAWETSRMEAHRLKEILTPIQESLLPWPASALIKAERPVKFRVFYR